MAVCQRYPGYAYPMLGLHPEEVRADWREVLSTLRSQLSALNSQLSTLNCIAIGEVGLDYYWSREFEKEQLEAFEEQVRWSVETRLPLMIHCRKAQNEMVAILKRYARDLPGGVFHCFTGNEIEAHQLVGVRPFRVGYRWCVDVQEESSARGATCQCSLRPYRPGDRCPLYGARPHAWQA